MYLIIGLGNPESEYEKTRHNMGFNVINRLAEKYEIETEKSKFRGLFGSGIIEGEKVILLKPQTYMNLSGESIIEAINFYKIATEEVIVIYDDIDIEQGNIRIRKNGSSGSHNGMKSVISHLGTEEFTRIRIGIGKESENKVDMIKYVIGPIPEEDKKILDEGVDKATKAVVQILKKDVDYAMNMFN